MIKQFLEIGQIVSTHGIRGEVRVNPWCDSPEFFKRFKTLYFDRNGAKKAKVLSCRPHGNIVILLLDGVDSAEKAAKMRNAVLYMNRSDAPLDDGQYYIQDLLDCSVFDVDDERIKYGVITDVSQTGANDVWHITGENGREYLIPAIPSVVFETNVKDGVIKIRPLRGIFDDED